MAFSGGLLVDPNTAGFQFAVNEPAQLAFLDKMSVTLRENILLSSTGTSWPTDNPTPAGKKFYIFIINNKNEILKGFVT